ncbi:glycosyltransferase family 25 protein [Synechococcus sp. BS55D]|uniref:glycosyltransferase family 25 protein n=1 Tax=Synechococcus sp. BS55D TaxID=2055943 RepID=UPI0013755FDC|nr:glycosyltransferase family 25 protein [Synechococcus sp. BS55D]
MTDHLYVISLKRTPHRLEAFLRRNAEALQDWSVHVLEGVDGSMHQDLFNQSRLISQNVVNGWTAGAIGSALSHMLSWRRCIQLGEPIVVAEDDAILARNLKQELAVILNRNETTSGFLLLGWNLDSLLQAEILEGLELISLFEPAYPDETALGQLVNSSEPRKNRKLKRCFGLPAYRITPDIATILIEKFNPIVAQRIEMGRGIPTHYSETLDGLLNNEYEAIDASIVIPPLALALNVQSESLTRKQKTAQNFMG